IPIYLRTTRAEVLEVRERIFVQAAKVMGSSYWRIVFHHILPVIFPTLVTVWNSTERSRTSKRCSAIFPAPNFKAPALRRIECDTQPIRQKV
ncbi:ABC transporter permease subunit, partial [Rhizobium ruizarguesonis]